VNGGGQQFHLTHVELYFALTVFVLAALTITAFRIIEWLSKNLALLIILRWLFLGHHWHGKKVTDATFWSHASTTKRQHGHGGFMDRWEHKPHSHRLLWRWACLLSGAGLIYGAITERIVTAHALMALVMYGLVCGVFVTESKIRLRVHNRHVISPIVKSLSGPQALRLSPHAVRLADAAVPEARGHPGGPATAG
jgi:hypothetical protein